MFKVELNKQTLKRTNSISDKTVYCSAENMSIV